MEENKENNLKTSDIAINSGSKESKVYKGQGLDDEKDSFLEEKEDHFLDDKQEIDESLNEEKSEVEKKEVEKKIEKENAQQQKQNEDKKEQGLDESIQKDQIAKDFNKSRVFCRRDVNCGCSFKRLFFVLGISVLIIVIAFFMLSTFKDDNGTKPNGSVENHTVVYNGFTFNKELIGWSTLLWVGDNVYDLRMKYNPSEVDYFEIDNQSRIVDRLLNSDLVLITMDPFIESEVALAGLEISKIMNPRKEDTGILGIPTIIGVTHIPQGYHDKEVLVFDCENATNQSAFDKAGEIVTNGSIKIKLNEKKISVIKLEISEDTNRIFIEEDCIKIYGTNSSNVYKQANMLTYAILNIIPSKEFLELELVRPLDESITEDIDTELEIKTI